MAGRTTFWRRWVLSLLVAGLMLAGIGSVASAQYTSYPGSALPQAPVSPRPVMHQNPAPIQDAVNGPVVQNVLKEEEKSNPLSSRLELNQDSFFGFQPTLYAFYEINPVLDFSFYSILWTTPDFSAFGGGQGLWTEVGLGVRLKFLDNTWSVNPQIGILNGSLLSGATRHLPLEGYVPNIRVNHSDTFSEGEFYMGYYVAARDPRQNDFLHWWINAGVKPFGDRDDWLSIFAVGVHFEHLRLTRSRGGNPTDVYMWVGPYFQAAVSNRLSLRFSAGWDLDGDIAPGFYKSNIVFTF